MIADDTLLRYCTSLYKALKKTAKKTDEYELLWEGKFTELFGGLGISNSHYSRVINVMQEIGSTEMLRKGARGVTTLIALHGPPTAEALASAHGTQSRLTNPSQHDRLSQRVTVLEGRLQGIDIAKYIAHTEQRLRKLEAKGK